MESLVHHPIRFPLTTTRKIAKPGPMQESLIFCRQGDQPLHYSQHAKLIRVSVITNLGASHTSSMPFLTNWPYACTPHTYHTLTHTHLCTPHSKYHTDTHLYTPHACTPHRHMHLYTPQACTHICHTHMPHTHTLLYTSLASLEIMCDYGIVTSSSQLVLLVFHKVLQYIDA